MPTPLTVNGITFQYPVSNDQSWGQQATLWATAITSAVIPKAGGTFNLTGEVDFGTQYGLKVKSLRLNNSDVVSWRNAANTADLGLTVNGGNTLQFNGSEVFYGPGYVSNLAHASASAAGATPGSFATVNPSGKLNMVMFDNLTTYANNMQAATVTGQVKFGYKATASSSVGDNFLAYAIFDSNPIFYGTGSVHLPNGTTAQRLTATGAHASAKDPDTNTAVTDVGSFRYNTDYKTVEVHDGRRWKQGVYGDALVTAPQVFDDFVDGGANWSTTATATTSNFESTITGTMGIVTSSVSSSAGTGQAQLWKSVDCAPLNVDFAEFRMVCSVGAAEACGLSADSGSSGVQGTAGPGIMFYANFSGGSSSAHGAGNWFVRVQDANQTLSADTGVAAASAGTFQTLRLEIGSDKKTITFFINGTQVGQLVLTSTITRAANSWRPFFSVTQQNIGGTFYGTLFADYALVKFVNIRN